MQTYPDRAKSARSAKLAGSGAKAPAGEDGALRWDDMQLLLALVRRGSLKQAAEEMGVHISTVSRRLDGLEEDLGMHLFDRTSDGTLPTAAAEQLVPFAETMEQAAAGVRRTVEGYEQVPEGKVHVTAAPGLADQIIAPMLPNFIDRYPGVQIELSSSVGYADLTRRDADIALRGMRPASGDLIATRLVTTETTVVASRKMARRIGRLREAADARWLTWGEDLAYLPDGRWVAENVPKQQVVFRSSSMTALVEATRAGAGVMLAPRPFGDLPGLTTVKLAPSMRRRVGELSEATLWLVGHRALRDVPRIKTVWDWLREMLSGAPV